VINDESFKLVASYKDYNHDRTCNGLLHLASSAYNNFIMSSMNFSTPKQYVRPPQRGIFPLDHDSECKPFIEKYMSCLNEANDAHHKCKQLSKDYLQCRMDRKLMSKENLDDVSAAISSNCTPFLCNGPIHSC
jgi:cytochrome c oxidase assembly protein subunit 19